MMIAAMAGVLALGGGEAAAGPVSEAAQISTASEFSAQARRRSTRLRVYPGRLLYRDCTFRLAQQWRPGGTVIVPVQRCWWVRG
jgi:hypothetical protein